MSLQTHIVLRSGQSKESRFRGECRSYISVDAQETENCRKEGDPYKPLQGVNGEGVSETHYCYAFLPDDKNEVWVRELSCLGCSYCSSTNFLKLQNNRLLCQNSDVLGSWKAYPIIKKGEEDPRKAGKDGSFDGKKMFVPKLLHFLDMKSSHGCEVCSICRSKNEQSPKPVQFVFSGVGHAKRKHGTSRGKVLFP